MSRPREPSLERLAFDARKGGEAGPRYSVFQPAASAPPPPTVPAVSTEVGPDGWHRLCHDPLDLPGCRFGCIAVVALFWNTVIWGGMIVDAIWSGPKPRVAPPPARGFDPCLAVSTVWFLVFAGVGVFLALYAVAAGFNWTLLGLAGRPTTEVSAHPFRPGRTYRIRVNGLDRVRLFGTTIRLICQESVTVEGSEGNETSTRDVLVVSLHRGGGLPAETECIVPADAMHSFLAPGDNGTSSSVRWFLRVSGRLMHLFPYRQEYEVTVTPEEA